MTKSWMRRCGLLAAAAMLTTAGVALPAGAQTAKPQAPAKVRYAKLYTMKTTTGGFFYTNRWKEVRSAQKKYKFKLVKVNLGHLRSKGKGTYPFYRLRVKQGGNYIVSISKKERNRLVKSGRFVYEGTLGYVYKQKHAKTFRLWRLTNGKTWQIAKTKRANYLKHHGWKLDGPMGWIHK